MRIKFILLLSFSLMMVVACQTQKESYFIKKPISRQGRLAVLIQGKNEIKNAAFIEFLNAGYSIQGLNAADFYTLAEVFDIKTFKKNVKAATLRKKKTRYTASLIDRVFDNIYKLHIYNFENAKADYIRDLAKKWQVDFIVLVSMKNWQRGYSWVRVINTATLELEYVHNIQAGRADTYQTVLARMIQVMRAGK